MSWLYTSRMQLQLTSYKHATAGCLLTKNEALDRRSLPEFTIFSSHENAGQLGVFEGGRNDRRRWPVILAAARANFPV